MSTLTARRGMAVLAAAGLLLVTVFVAAPKVEASTLYACVKKNGTGRLFTKRPKCKKGESKISWNSQGIAGKNGANGANGVNGAAGAPGANGTNGTNGANGAVAGYSATGGEVAFTQ